MNQTAAKADQRKDPSVLSYLAVTLLLLLAAAVMYRDHPLVQLGSDRPDTVLFSTSDLEPGQSTSASVTLDNRGLIPFTYRLSVVSPSGAAIQTQFRVEIARGDAGPLLYAGSLPPDSGSLGTMVPGEHIRLGLRLSLPAGAPKTHLPLDLTFLWRAHATLPRSWWLPLGGLGAAVAIAAALFLVWRQRRGRLSRGAAWDQGWQ